MVSLLRMISHKVPFIENVYMKIAEPRNVRLLLCAIYILLGVVGVAGLFAPVPDTWQQALGGPIKVYAMYGFISLGALFGSVSVLPGVWWLERTGILSLGTGVGFYILILIDRKTSALGLIIAIIAILTFLIRWIEIRRYQLAPREG